MRKSLIISGIIAVIVVLGLGAYAVSGGYIGTTYRSSSVPQNQAGNVTPVSDNTYDLGTTSTQWRYMNLQGGLQVSNGTATTTLFLDTTTTLATSLQIGGANMFGASNTDFVVAASNFNSGAGKNITLRAGDATNGAGGSALIIPGLPTGVNQPGAVKIYSNSVGGGLSQIFDFYSGGQGDASIGNAGGISQITFGPNGASAAPSFRIYPIASSVNYWQATGAVSGGVPQLAVSSTAAGKIDGSILLKGNGFLGVATTSPRSALHVTSPAGTTTTIWAGDLTNVKGQICMGDSDGSGATCFYGNNGVLTAFTTSTY